MQDEIQRRESSSQLNSLDSKDHSRSEVTKLLFDVLCFSREFPTIDQLDHHAIQSKTFTDQLFLMIDPSEDKICLKSMDSVLHRTRTSRLSDFSDNNLVAARTLSDRNLFRHNEIPDE